MSENVEQPEPEVVVAEAARASSEATVEAIEEAAKVNEDPVVADALEDAALKATTTHSRLQWLRDRVLRVFKR